MEITEIRVNRVKKSSKSTLAAFANVTFDDEFVVKGFKIVEGRKGTFVSMPASEGKDGEYYDDVYPITKEFREYLCDAILDEFLSSASDEEEDEEVEEKNSTDRTRKAKRR